MYNIVKFLNDGGPVFDGGKQFVFTYNDEFTDESSQIEVLKNFMRQFNGGNDPAIDVYPLSRLFYVLRTELAQRGLVDAIPNEGYAKVFLSRDPYECLSGISCTVI